MKTNILSNAFLEIKDEYNKQVKNINNPESFNDFLNRRIRQLIEELTGKEYENIELLNSK